MERPEDIARKILTGLTEPPQTFIHEGYTHVVERNLRLPKDVHHPSTRKAPVQIRAYINPSEQDNPTISRPGSQFPYYVGAAQAAIFSGKWEKYVHDDERGFGLKPNDARHADVYLNSEPAGILRCHPNIETSQAPKIAAAWLGTICSLVEERNPTDAELAELQRHRFYKPENTGFYFVRAENVRPRNRFMRWLATRF